MNQSATNQGLPLLSVSCDQCDRWAQLVTTDSDKTEYYSGSLRTLVNLRRVWCQNGIYDENSRMRAGEAEQCD